MDTSPDMIIQQIIKIFNAEIIDTQPAGSRKAGNGIGISYHFQGFAQQNNGFFFYVDHPRLGAVGLVGSRTRQVHQQQGRHITLGLDPLDIETL